MKKVIYILLTLPVCAAFGFTKLWIGFSAVYSLFLFKRIGKSALWEIPMGVLACSIALDLTDPQYATGIRIIIPFAALLTAFFEPKKFLLSFVVSIAALMLKNEYGLAMIFATVWCSGRTFIEDRQASLEKKELSSFSLSYFNTKKRFLQGRKRKYVELSKKM